MNLIKNHHPPSVQYFALCSYFPERHVSLERETGNNWTEVKDKQEKENTRPVPVGRRIERMAAARQRPALRRPRGQVSAIAPSFVGSVPGNRCKRSIHCAGWPKSWKWARDPSRPPKRATAPPSTHRPILFTGGPIKNQVVIVHTLTHRLPPEARN